MKTENRGKKRKGQGVDPESLTGTPDPYNQRHKYWTSVISRTENSTFDSVHWKLVEVGIGGHGSGRQKVPIVQIYEKSNTV